MLWFGNDFSVTKVTYSRYSVVYDLLSALNAIRFGVVVLNAQAYKSLQVHLFAFDFWPTVFETMDAYHHKSLKQQIQRIDKLIRRKWSWCTWQRPMSMNIIFLLINSAHKKMSKEDKLHSLEPDIDIRWWSNESNVCKEYISKRDVND